MSPLDPAPFHAHRIRELSAAGNWAGLVRYWISHQHKPALEEAVAVARRSGTVGKARSILVDFLGARNGIGYLLVASLSIGESQSTILWSALVISMALGLAFTRVIVVLERRLCFWQPAFREAAA